MLEHTNNHHHKGTTMTTQNWITIETFRIEELKTGIPMRTVHPIVKGGKLIGWQPDIVGTFTSYDEGDSEIEITTSSGVEVFNTWEDGVQQAQLWGQHPSFFQDIDDSDENEIELTYFQVLESDLYEDDSKPEEFLATQRRRMLEGYSRMESAILALGEGMGVPVP
jgi:hypothetical protein